MAQSADKGREACAVNGGEKLQGFIVLLLLLVSQEKSSFPRPTPVPPAFCYVCWRQQEVLLHFLTMSFCLPYETNTVYAARTVTEGKQRAERDKSDSVPYTAVGRKPHLAFRRGGCNFWAVFFFQSYETSLETQQMECWQSHF